ncbi:PH domain-containing protein [Microbacterium sp. Sa4CUA7]|uniref:PH domain-containing protein n=1 Tax=Microbacterium pullorum TaxID=2762236 RepID=A0ABR8S155_9MICO|nr:PH domain-containing protein [Microbacterium pullorum]MBD7956789.1 PH domain-containing protein [Microbacterium pullorum]
MPDRRIFRSTSGTVSMIVAGVVAVFLLGDALVRAGLGETMLLAPWVLLIVWVVYAVVYEPRVETDAAGITVVNILRRTTVPWGRVTDIGTRWQLTVHVDDGSRVRAFGGPSLRPPRRRPFARDNGEADAARFSDTELIRQQWEDSRDSGSAGAAVQHQWNGVTLALLAGLAIWAGTAVFIVATAA